MLKRRLCKVLELCFALYNVGTTVLTKTLRNATSLIQAEEMLIRCARRYPWLLVSVSLCGVCMRMCVFV
jgi:hypothetical protein